MNASKVRPARTLPLVLAWAVGAIGTVTTAISLIPAVAGIASVSGLASPIFAIPLLVTALMYLLVPTLIALAIANAARRWWLWLAIAMAIIILLLIARPAMGSLGVYWLSW